jgi:hypothetical protein
MMTLRKTVLAFAVAGTFALGAAGPAHAYVMASSMIKMSDFEIQGTIDSEFRRLDANDFSTLLYNGGASYSGNLTGFTGFTTATTTTLEGGSIDLPAKCIGSDCGSLALVENTFPKLQAPPAGNYVAADQLESGAPITGLIDFGDDPATIASAAYAGLVDITAAGQAQSTNVLTSTFEFALSESTALTFSFDVEAWLQVALTADEIAPGFATASYQFDFAIVDLDDNTIFAFSPNLFSADFTGLIPPKTVTRNAPLQVNQNAEIIRNRNITSLSFSSPLLEADTTYKLDLRMQTNAEVQRENVPEPGTLALIGLGLLGLGTSSRRMLRKSAA